MTKNVIEAGTINLYKVCPWTKVRWSDKAASQSNFYIGTCLLFGFCNLFSVFKNCSLRF